MLFFRTKNPDEFDTWKQVNRYCLKRAKEQQISLNEFVSKLPDDLFNHFKNVLTHSAYSEKTNLLGDIQYSPKPFAETICDVFDKERNKRLENKRLEAINDAIFSYSSKNGSVIYVEKDKIFHEGHRSTHKGGSVPDYETQGYNIYLQYGESAFLLGSVDTRKKNGGFMDDTNIGTNKSSQDYVKKYLKDTFGISQITKPENEKEILKDILINGKENKDFINFYLAEFLIKESQLAQKEKVRGNIEKEKIKAKIKSRIQKNKRDKNRVAMPTRNNVNTESVARQTLGGSGLEI